MLPKHQKTEKAKTRYFLCHFFSFTSGFFGLSMDKDFLIRLTDTDLGGDGH
jgi:hypothetical protein